jgi:hypothetical protein
VNAIFGKVFANALVVTTKERDVQCSVLISAVEMAFAMWMLGDASAALPLLELAVTSGCVLIAVTMATVPHHTAAVALRLSWDLRAISKNVSITAQAMGCVITAVVHACAMTASQVRIVVEWHHPFNML